MATSRSRRRIPLAAALIVLSLLVVEGLAEGQEMSMVPVTVDGQTVRLAMRLYKPVAAGPAPTLVFNHGSTGSGTDPGLFARPLDFPALARFFVDRGWAVVMPARRGRGGSEGEYDEGFSENRARGYSCEPGLSIPGADRALSDVEAAMGTILAMPFVDRSRVVIGGQSRGGILSVAYAGRHGEQVKGVINFVGGWMGTRCRNASAINEALFARGGRYADETLWLYGDDDPYYPLGHSRANFAAFERAGGKGSFHGFPPGAGGHRIVANPNHWGAVVDAYLARRGLPTTR
jgi:dienelactone hydrolase